MSEQNQKLIMMLIGLLPFVIIGFILYRTVYGIKKHQRANAAKLKDFQDQCCRALEIRDMHNGKDVVYTCINHPDGRVEYVSSPREKANVNDGDNHNGSNH